MARAERPAGGEIGTLVRGFNAMSTICSGKRNGSKSASPETVRPPLSSSYRGNSGYHFGCKRFDGSILYSNIDAAHPLWSSVFAEDNPHGALGLLTPASRSAFLGIRSNSVGSMLSKHAVKMPRMNPSGC